MATLQDADNKLTALGPQFTALSADIQKLIDQSGQSGPLVDSINSKLDALGAAFTAEDATVNADGAPPAA